MKHLGLSLLLLFLLIFSVSCGGGSSSADKDTDIITGEVLSDASDNNEIKDQPGSDVEEQKDEAGENHHGDTDSFDQSGEVEEQPDIDITEATIGTDGGKIETLDGEVTLIFPKGALSHDTKVILGLYNPKSFGKGLILVNRAVEITLDPEPENNLPVPAFLIFNNIKKGDKRLRIARKMSKSGIDVETGEQKSFVYWRPLNYTRFTPDGSVTVWLSRFSSYGVAKGEGSEDDIPADLLEPPEAPEGMVYVGRFVVKNMVFDDKASTLPPDWPDPEWQKSYIRSKTVVEDGVTKQDIIVEHIFVPEDKKPKEPDVSNLINPPDAPEGFEYVGYDVVVNFGVKETTIPLERDESPEDFNIVQEKTLVDDYQCKYDVQIRYLYQPKKEDKNDVTKTFEKPEDSDYNMVEIDDYPPETNNDYEKGEDVPNVKGFSVGAFGRSGLRNDSMPVAPGEIFSIFIDFELKKGEISAMFMQPKGKKKYLLFTGLETFDWNDGVTHSVEVKVKLSPEASQFIGEHLFNIAIAPKDDNGGIDTGKTSNYIEVPIKIVEKNE